MNQLDLKFHSASSDQFHASKAGIKLISETVFSIPTPLKRHFSEFYLLYWSGEFILEQSWGTEGTISRNDKVYHIR